MVPCNSTGTIFVALSPAPSQIFSLACVEKIGEPGDEATIIGE